MLAHLRGPWLIHTQWRGDPEGYSLPVSSRRLGWELEGQASVQAFLRDRCWGRLGREGERETQRETDSAASKMGFCSCCGYRRYGSTWGQGGTGWPPEAQARTREELTGTTPSPSAEFTLPSPALRTSIHTPAPSLQSGASHGDRGPGRPPYTGRKVPGDTASLSLPSQPACLSLSYSWFIRCSPGSRQCAEHLPKVRTCP